VTARRKRTTAERIAETIAWYEGAPARNAPGPLPGADFLESLPEGATLEINHVALDTPAHAPTIRFEVRHVARARGLPAKGSRMKAKSVRTCMHCNRPGGVGARELRPYGPGGRDVCAECTFNGPRERLKEAERQLSARLWTGELLLDSREQVGPRPIKSKGRA
jgi:hypothetical protein